MSHKGHGDLESSGISQQSLEVLDLLGKMVKRTMGTNDWGSRKMVDTIEQRGDDEEGPNPRRRAEAEKAENYLEVRIGVVVGSERVYLPYCGHKSDRWGMLRDTEGGSVTECVQLNPIN